MASLTPNEDKVRAMPASPEIEAMKSRPGQAGVTARVVAAMMNTYAITVAQEFDRGSSSEEILIAFGNALGQIVGSLTCGSGQATHDIAQTLLRRISLVGGMTVGAHEAGLSPSVTVGPDEAGRA